MISRRGFLASFTAALGLLGLTTPAHATPATAKALLEAPRIALCGDVRVFPGLSQTCVCTLPAGHSGRHETPTGQHPRESAVWWDRG